MKNPFFNDIDTYVRELITEQMDRKSESESDPEETVSKPNSSPHCKEEEAIECENESRHDNK